jgi:hypothetical protein
VTATEQDITYKFAGEGDDLRVIRSFSAMLKELAELGHDVLPTEANLDFFWEFVFEPAIRSGKHGIVLAIDDHDCVGALFIVPERSRIQTPENRAIAHGAWVDPTHRKLGIALKMQEMSHARMKELGYTQVISAVVSENAAGLASCRRAGAKITGFVTTVYL